MQRHDASAPEGHNAAAFCGHHAPRCRPPVSDRTANGTIGYALGFAGQSASDTPFYRRGTGGKGIGNQGGLENGFGECLPTPTQRHWLFRQTPASGCLGGVEESVSLLALKKQVDDALALHAGLKAPDGRFSPHITLGRAKRADKAVLKNFTAKYGDATTASFKVESFILFSSVLAPGGAVHTVEEQYPLVDGAPPEQTARQRGFCEK